MSGDEKIPSEEVDENQLSMARTVGEAYRDSVSYMANTVVHSGGEREDGEYLVAFAQEEAEGLYALEDGELVWREPKSENCHLEIAVMDAEDGRFVPYLDVRATLERDGEEYGPFELPFLWHPGLNHYGANVELPGDGTYALRVRADPPTFHRHDRENGDRFADPIDVTFEDVDVKTGQG